MMVPGAETQSRGILQCIAFPGESRAWWWWKSINLGIFLGIDVLREMAQAARLMQGSACS
jgi:hypothetical protein